MTGRSSGIVAFIVLAYASAWAITLVLHATGGVEGPFAGLWALSMFVPALASVAVRLARREGWGDVRWRAFSLRWTALGMIAPALYTAAIGLAYLRIAHGPLRLAQWLTPQADGLIHPSEAAALGSEPFAPQALGSRLFVKLVVLLLPLLVFAFGEELGWRSYLQTRLDARLGPRRAIVATALIWAYFHLGFFTLDLEGRSGPIAWIAIAFVAPAALFPLGIFYGWLFQRTGSLWVVTIAHAACNKWAGAPMRFLAAPEDDFAHKVVLGLAGVAAGALLAFFLPLRDASPALAQDRGDA